MIRHNAHIQKLADDAAREEDFFCASYYGRIDGPCAFSRVGYDGPTFVYHGQHRDSLERATGLPYLFLVQGEEVVSVCDEISFEIIEQVKHPNRFPHGKRLFLQHQRKFEDPSAPEKERRYSSEIVHACQRYSYDCAIPLRTMYEFLEIAERFHKKIKIVPNPSTTDRCDGWEYYIKIV